MLHSILNTDEVKVCKFISQLFYICSQQCGLTCCDSAYPQLSVIDESHVIILDKVRKESFRIWGCIIDLFPQSEEQVVFWTLHRVFLTHLKIKIIKHIHFKNPILSIAKPLISDSLAPHTIQHLLTSKYDILI